MAQYINKVAVVPSGGPQKNVRHKADELISSYDWLSDSEINLLLSLGVIAKHTAPKKRSNKSKGEN